MEKIFLTLTAVFILTVSSCSNPSSYYSVWRGNNLFTGGDYQTANTSYLNALNKNVYTDYISYNLANVYYALGEGEAASAEWEKAARSKDDELLFRTMYNKGVLEYESGLYQEAFDSFKHALEIQPGNTNAKINLEYSLSRINSGANAAEASAAGAQVTDEKIVSDEIQRVLEFVKQKEAEAWKSNEDQGTASAENDW